MEPAGKLARIDETLDRVMQDPEDGYALLALLGAAGWSVSVTPTWSDGVVVTGERRGAEICLRGLSVAHVAVEFFRVASAIAYAQERPA